MPGYEMMFEKGRSLLPWPWAVERLSTAHNYWVATSRTDGRPHVMPVWGVWLDNQFCFSTGRRSRKSRNLVENPNCVVCPEGAGEAIILEGVAREVRDPLSFKRFARTYKRKYDWAVERTKDPIYAVRPRVVFGFVENPGEIRGNPTRWTFSSNPAERRCRQAMKRT